MLTSHILPLLHSCDVTGDVLEGDGVLNGQLVRLALGAGLLHDDPKQISKKNGNKAYTNFEVQLNDLKLDLKR